jgi:hypothetical protein
LPCLASASGGNVEKLENIHLLVQNRPPQYVGGEEIPPSVWYNLAQSNHQEQNKVLGDLGERKPESCHENPLKQSDVAAINGPSYWILIKHPHRWWDVIIPPKNLIVFFENTGLPPILQRLEIWGHVGLFALQPRSGGNATKRKGPRHYRKEERAKRRS